MSSFGPAHGETNAEVKVGNFDKFVFPILRKVSPKLIADDLVSIQPMTRGPVIRICCYDPEDYPELKAEDLVKYNPFPSFFISQCSSGTKRAK